MRDYRFCEPETEGSGGSEKSRGAIEWGEEISLDRPSERLKRAEVLLHTARLIAVTMRHRQGDRRLLRRMGQRFEGVLTRAAAEVEEALRSLGVR